jgi:N-acetyl-anhydromuramyl-L-alanine amidase AmpD
MAWYEHLKQYSTSSYDYPGTSYFIESPNFQVSPGGSRNINQIVIHITGGHSISESSAINQFLKKAQSAHYIVNRQGVIVQMVRDQNIANHIRKMKYHVSQHSIGIEHVNTWLPGNKQHPTSIQYQASAALVRWLCKRYGIPKIHSPNPHTSGIKGHIEADPQSGHTSCPNPAWDWNHYVGLL